MAFNKPDVNEEELRAMQRKKASYNAKLAKFELGGELDKRRVSQAKVKAKMFEEMEGQVEREKEAELRKEEFKKKKEVFKESDEKPEEDEAAAAEGEVSKRKAVFESSQEDEKCSSDDEKKCDDEMTEALERERRREEFLEKQTLFGK